MGNWKKAARDRWEDVRDEVRGMDFEVDLDRFRREEEAASKGFIGGFLLGLVIGAVLALVFAPLKGEQTRDLVSERAVQLKEKATDLVAQVRGEENAAAGGIDGPAIEREIGDAIKTT